MSCIDSSSPDQCDRDFRNEQLNEFRRILEDNQELAEQVELMIFLKIREEHNLDGSLMFDKKALRAYRLICCELFENLDPASSIGNDYLHLRVMSGEITPERLVQMSNEELFPTKWERIKEKRLQEIKNQNEQKVATTDLYRCSRCKKRQCTFFQLQTRSQDEPMTIFITCTNCGAKWKE